MKGLRLWTNSRHCVVQLLGPDVVRISPNTRENSFPRQMKQFDLSLMDSHHDLLQKFHQISTQDITYN